jgi:4-carboxymuconolactone decarboxylase
MDPGEPRIPLLTDRDALDAEGRAVFDRIVESRGAMLRPFELLLHTPVIADRVAALGHTIRFGSRLSDTDRELVTLATGRARDCPFVWESHLDSALAAGVTPATIAALGSGPGDLDQRDTSLIAFVDALCRHGSVDDDTFRSVHEALGDEATVELAVTVGYYSMLALTMRACGAC